MHSDDDILYSKKSKPILSDYDRKKYADTNTSKLIELPRTLFSDVKEAKYKIEKKSGSWINESIVYRVGARLVLEGIDMLSLDYINSEEELLEELKKLYNINQEE